MLLHYLLQEHPRRLISVVSNYLVFKYLIQGLKIFALLTAILTNNTKSEVYNFIVELFLLTEILCSLICLLYQLKLRQITYSEKQRKNTTDILTLLIHFAKLIYSLNVKFCSYLSFPYLCHDTISFIIRN